MAEPNVDGSATCAAHGATEKAEGLRGDIRVPLSAVTAVRFVDDPWRERRGIRAPGSRGFSYRPMAVGS